MIDRRRARLAGLLALVAAALAAGFLLPVRDWTVALVDGTQRAGAWGVVGFTAAYVVGPLLLLPTALLTLGAGFLYGRLWGALLVSLGANLTAWVAFGLARTVLRERVRRAIAHHAKLRAVDEAVGAQGFKLIVLLRLSPIIPFNLVNYALGASGVSFASYALATAVGIIPGTVLYASLGAAVQSAAQIGQGVHPPGLALWLGLAATALAVTWVSWIARRALQRQLPPEENS